MGIQLNCEVTMGESEKTIPEETIEAIARTFFKETVHYGFRQVDYLRFVNQVLDMSMKNGQAGLPAERTHADYTSPAAMTMPLCGEGVMIRPFDPSGDRATYDRWIKDENGRYFLLSRTMSKTMDIDHLIASDENIFGVITLTDSTPIGMMAFLDYDRVQKKAELRKLIGEVQQRGKGLAKKATELWIRYGVSTLGLKKIFLSTLEANVRNIRLNEDLGFKVEGILRNECLVDGEYRDILRMALLQE